MIDLKPIETKYNGILYRSRLEARWAMFFNILGITAMYEPEGYRLPSGNYLPDFFIPEQRKFSKALWVEVKGVASDLDWTLLGELSQSSGTRGTMLFDIPYISHIPMDGSYGFSEHTLVRFPPDGWYDECICLFPGGGHDLPYLFTQCPECGGLGFEFDGRSARIGCCSEFHATIANGDKTYNSGALEIVTAMRAARTERFNW